MRCGFDSWGWEDTLEKKMATRPSILAWKIPWTKEAGGLQAYRTAQESDTNELNNNSLRKGRLGSSSSQDG